MASSLPIPAPPRTPTPPTPIPGDEEEEGLGMDGVSRTVRSTIHYDPGTLDPNALSPWSDQFAGSSHFGAMESALPSPASTVGELRTDGSSGPPPAGGRNPFNFQTQTIKDTPVVAKSVCRADFQCIPSINVLPSTPPSGRLAAMNLFPIFRDVPQTPPSVDFLDSDDDGYSTDDCLSRILKEQSGNAFRRNNSTARSYASKKDNDDKFAVKSCRQFLANLTPPTDTYPYIFPFVNTDKQNIGQRRGHRYKHSSVSTQHQIFLEPPPRPPLALPAALPIPTYKETWKSLSSEQIWRSIWCICHFSIAGIVHHSGDGSAALTALSHLIFFDAGSASLCVAVDISHNFEVWKRSSIRHPFGLQRVEVLAGFAMSIFLVFMGFDLISHNLKHFLESLGSHQPHHPHSHERVAPGSVDLSALLSIVGTAISAYWMGNHARIGNAMRFQYLSFLPSILSNPSHFLTLFCSFLMLALPLLSITMYTWLDRMLCAAIAGSMFFLGLRSATAQGLMLLMSYNGKGVTEVMREIVSEPAISGVEEARFWQVHYGLAMANLKLRVRGFGGGAAEDVTMGKLRERISLLIRKRLGGEYGKGSGLRWEVTIQLDADGRA